MKAFWILASITFALVAIGASAQAPPDEKADGKAPIAKKAEVRQLLEEVMIARISKELALNDEQTVLIVRRFAEFRDKGREARMQRKKLVDEMKAAVLAPENGAVVEEKLKAILALDTQIAQNRTAAFEVMAEGLTPQQRGKLYLFLADFEGDLRRMVQNAKEGGVAREGRRLRPAGKAQAPQSPPNP